MQVTEDEQKLAKHHMIDILDSTAVNSVVDFREVIAIIFLSSLVLFFLSHLVNT